MELEVYEALQQIELAILEERKKFNNALRRRIRASEQLANAESDMAKISGAMQALERMHRIITGTEEKIIAQESSSDSSIPPRQVTLAG